MLFERKIRAALIWMRAAALVDGMAWGAAIASCIALLLVLGMKAGFLLISWKFLLAVTAALVGMAALANVVRQRVTKEDAALALDRHYGLKERVISGFHAFRMKDQTFAPLLVADAESAAAALNPRAVASTNTRKPAGVALCGAMLALLSLQYVPEFDVLGMQRKARAEIVTQQAIQNQVAKLDELQKKLSAAGETTHSLENVKPLAKEIADLNKSITDARAPNTRDTMAKLSSLSDKLDQAKKELKSGTRADLKPMESDRQPGGLTSQLERALRRGDMEAAGSELKRLKEQATGPGATPEQNARMGAELGRLGKAVEGQPRLSGAFAETAKGLQQGDLEKARAGFDEAEKAAKEIADRQEEMRRIEQALTEIENSKSELAAAENAAQSLAAGESQQGGDKAGEAGGEKGESGAQAGASSGENLQSGKSQAGSKSGSKSGSSQQSGGGQGEKSGNESGESGQSQSSSGAETQSGEGGQSTFSIGAGQSQSQSGQSGQQGEGSEEQSGSQQSGSQSGGTQSGQGQSGQPGQSSSSSSSQGQQASSASGNQAGQQSSNGMNGQGGQGQQGGSGAPDWGVGTTNLEAGGSGKDAQQRTGQADSRIANRDSRWTEEFIKLYDSRITQTKGATSQAKGQIGEGEFDFSMDVEGQGRREAPKVDSVKAFMDYREAQKDSLGREDIPVGYKEYVKSYFDSIEPPAAKP